MARFGGSIEATAWTITGYNLAACLAAAAIIPLRTPRRARWALVGGLLFFACSTAACAAASSLSTLVALRVAEGAGAGLALAGAVLALGASRVAASTVVGLAVGPALGGVLTESFDWRAIFVAQVPVALAALLVTRVAGVERVDERAQRGRLAPCAALLLASSALVAVLLLVVVLLSDAYGLSPLATATVVSTLPAAGVAAARVRAPVAAGLALLTAGLALLALSAGTLPLVVAALIVCGAGIGLSLARLSGEAGLLGVVARHGGVVLGLMLITPPLAHAVTSNARDAEAAGAARVVRAPVPLLPKAMLGVRLYGAVRAPSDGRMPDLAPAFDGTIRWFPAAAPQLRALERELRTIEVDAVARAFTRSFGIASLLAACALLIAIVPRAREPDRVATWRTTA
jgi:predicted MFS family arabinose efflux permease